MISDLGRRPLLRREQPHALRLGRQIAMLRRTANLSQRDLAIAADLSRVQVSRIETGSRRTRRSTLARIALALVAELPTAGPVETLAGDLATTAGPALAEESPHAERVAQRRALRSAATQRAEAAREHRAQLYRAYQHELREESMRASRAREQRRRDGAQEARDLRGRMAGWD